jgi:hypothetical protein
MFGLMKARSCSQPSELKLHRRLHYCGTCKTLGGLYGQKTRALLNHDTVFFAEVLSAISVNKDALGSWNRSYQSYNCLSLPHTREQMPLPLQLAATATLVLAEFKIADHIKDSKRRIWKTARRLFSHRFREASARLKEWQFPLDELQQALSSQEAREARALESSQAADALLDDLTGPTATATALFCRHGARLVGQASHEQTMYALGYHFGAIAYLIDAIEDYEKDWRNAEFNAIGAAHKISDARLPVEIRRRVVKKVRLLQSQIETSLVDLPMSDEMREMFAARLQANLSRKLGGLPVLNANALQQTQQPGKTGAQVCQKQIRITERWKNAVAFSQEIARNYRKSASTTFLNHCASRITSPMVFASVLPLAFFAPQQAMSTQSFGECMSLGFNLMFIGSVISFITMTVSKPLRFSAPEFGTGEQMPSPEINDTLGAQLDQEGRKRRRGGEDNGSSWCDGCDCGCCDCSEGWHCCPECSCCDGCNCCD